MNRNLGVSVLALLLITSFSIASDPEVCVETQSDNCPPAACEACAGLFMPCWDQECHYQNKECVEDSNGDLNCSDTLVSMVSGQTKECRRGAIDWSGCLGQPSCDVGTIDDVSGSRYDC